MTIISTHRCHSYKYTHNPKTFRGGDNRKYMSKTREYLRNKTHKQKEDMVPHDVYTGGCVYTVMLPKNVDLYTGLKRWFPEMLYAIINNIVPITIAAATIATAAITTSAITTSAIATAVTILRPVIEVDYDDANEEAWNQLDYQEWLCD